MSHVDRYEQMTVRELLETARHRPLSGRHRRKAELIDELRRMDERRARGEPEGNYEHSQWSVGQAMEDFKSRQQQKAVEDVVLRVQALLGRPGREPAYYDGVPDALGEVRNAPPPTDEQWALTWTRSSRLWNPLAGRAGMCPTFATRTSTGCTGRA